MRCTICGTARSTRHRIDRGLYVFCCDDCLALVRDVHEHYGDDAHDGEPAPQRRAV